MPPFTPEPVAPKSVAPEKADLAYLTRLARAGQGAPAPFLTLMAVFGGAYGLALLALLIVFAVEGGPTPNGPPSGPVANFVGQWAFIAAHLIFLAALIWTAWRMVVPGRPRLNRAAAATWTAAFIALVTAYVAVRLFSRDEPPTDAVYSIQLIGPFALVLWGAAWWVTAIMSERRWLLVVAFGSFAAAIALAYVGNSLAALPVICASLLLLALAPAVALIVGRRP